MNGKCNKTHRFEYVTGYCEVIVSKEEVRQNRLHEFPSHWECKVELCKPVEVTREQTRISVGRL